MTNAESRALTLQFLARDKALAMADPSLAGFHVVDRGDDWPCPRSASFAGDYLVRDLPDLFPPDCQNELGCHCVWWQFILRDDPGAGALARPGSRQHKRRRP
jgi:hypothetical protein